MSSIVSPSVSTFHDHNATPAAVTPRRRCFSFHTGELGCVISGHYLRPRKTAPRDTPDDRASQTRAGSQHRLAGWNAGNTDRADRYAARALLLANSDRPHPVREVGTVQRAVGCLAPQPFSSQAILLGDVGEPFSIPLEGGLGRHPVRLPRLAFQIADVVHVACHGRRTHRSPLSLSATANKDLRVIRRVPSPSPFRNSKRSPSRQAFDPLRRPTVNSAPSASAPPGPDGATPCTWNPGEWSPPKAAGEPARRSSPAANNPCSIRASDRR